MQLTLDLTTVKRSWLAESEQYLRAAMSGKQFTTDDLHGLLAPPAHWNWYGVLMARLSRSGLAEKLGYVMSKRREANGRAIAEWRMK